LFFCFLKKGGKLKMSEKNISFKKCWFCKQARRHRDGKVTCLPLSILEKKCATLERGTTAEGCQAFQPRRGYKIKKRVGLFYDAKNNSNVDVFETEGGFAVEVFLRRTKNCKYYYFSSDELKCLSDLLTNCKKIF
jgi:hypothetical protein